jgi:hypothetical protein
MLVHQIWKKLNWTYIQSKKVALFLTSLCVVLVLVHLRMQDCSQVPVAHACNPGYSGGRDQEDCGSKSAWANSSVRPYLEKPFTKIGLVLWLKVRALSSSPSAAKKQQQKRCMIAESCGRCVSSFVRSHQSAFHGGCTILHSTSSDKSSCCSTSSQHLVTSLFWIVAF